jgi:hypothetical protein
VHADLGTLRRGAEPAVAVEIGRAVAGVRALTLTLVSRNSLAYTAVTMFSAVFEDGYGTEAIMAIGLPGSVVAVIEPSSLDTLTIPAGAGTSSPTLRAP